MKEFKLTPKNLKALLEACKPVPYMVIGGVMPKSPEQNANEAWEQLGREMGFDWTTVEPIPGKGQECFKAEEKK